MNWNNLTYKTKNKYLLVASVAFLVLAYLLAFSKTINLYQTNADLKKKLIIAEEAPKKRAIMEAKANALKEKMSSYFADSLKDQEHLLEVISTFCLKNHLLLRAFPEEEYYEDKEFIVGTTEISVEGNFINLLKLVHLLEQKEAVGRVSSTSFDTIFDNKRKKKVLVLTVYLQTLRVKIEKPKKEDEKV